MVTHSLPVSPYNIGVEKRANSFVNFFFLMQQLLNIIALETLFIREIIDNNILADTNDGNYCLTASGTCFLPFLSGILTCYHR